MTEPAPQADVLIAGAGPAGLVLALALTHSGIRVRIIDKAAGPGTTSRALVVQARILEQYEQLGIAGAVVNAGLAMQALNFWAKGKRMGRAPFGAMGMDLSPFPYALIYPQDEHEKFLVERLAALGVNVERNTELVSLAEEGDSVRATIRGPGGESVATCSYLAGCDGAHAKTRELLGAGFPGGTYSHVFYVADVEAKGAMMNRELHVAVDDADFLAVFPLREQGRARFIGIVKDTAIAAGSDLAWEDVSQAAIERLKLTVDRVHWFSTYRVHHRVAQSFRKGRVFLLGDAAHIHSPVGGQGMNTGIGDALNLAWKLAAVVKARAAPTLLDSYEPERQAFAYRLVASTDRAFTFVTRDGAIARFVRLTLAPVLIPLAFSISAMRRFMFRTVSQINVNYRPSALSQGAAGNVHAGDRLPWLDGEKSGIEGGNFAPLASRDWQVHVYGAPTDPLKSFCSSRNLPLHEFCWKPVMARAGFAHNALYFIRPDGYVALADPRAAPEKLSAYLAAHGLGFSHL